MMGWILVGLCLLWGRVASADTLCVEKATGKLLEYQSDATPGICQKNWVTDNPQYGYTKDQVDEQFISRTDWKARQQAEHDAALAALQKQQASTQATLDTVKTKLGLTDEQMKALVQ